MLVTFVWLMCIRFPHKKFEFPVNTLVGSRYPNIKEIVAQHTVDKAYRKKYFFTLASARILGVLSRREEQVYRQKIKQYSFNKPPIFIIGFWRSGTTLMHQLLTKNPAFGFLNTYHSVFPNHVLTNQWWLKRIALTMLPEKRPGDRMKLDFNYPQEEEIALGNLQPFSFYHFFYFPRDFESLVMESLFFDGIGQDKLEQWKDAYIRLINTALINTKGKQFVSKNPPNTFRIKILLDMFPDAKFIYMHRNTYETLSSFIGFMHEVHQGITFQNYDKAAQELRVIEFYKTMRETYSKLKPLIPEGQLVEVKFEHFEQNMKSEMQRIYNVLDLSDFNKALPFLEHYLDELKYYKRKNHKPDQSFKQFIDSQLGELVEK